MSSSIAIAEPSNKCPDGAQKGEDPPAGHELWCEKPDGIKQGKYTRWYKDTKAKETEGEYRNGKKEGRWTEWHQNGKVSATGDFKDSKRNGMWTIYYETGQKYADAEFREDKQNGSYVRYFKSGSKFGEGTYKDGVKIGHVVFYCEDGSKTWEADLVDEEVNKETLRRYKQCPNPDEVDDDKDDSSESSEAEEEGAKGRSETDKASVKKQYSATRGTVFRNRQGSKVALRGEQTAKGICSSLQKKADIWKQFNKECKLARLEKVDGVEVGTSDRSCLKARQVYYMTKMQQLDILAKRQRASLQPIATAAFALGADFQEKYSEFIRNALDCFCPDPATGDSGPCVSR